MNIKQIIAFLGISLISQSAFSQFTLGANPSTLGNISVGSHVYPSSPARINIQKTYTGLPASGAPIGNWTTGLKINHRFSGTGSSYTNHIWDIAADYRRLYFHYGNTNKHIFTLNTDGKVGVGITNPNATFHVNNFNGTGLDAHLEGFTLIDGNQASLLLGAETNAPYGEWGIEYNPHAKGLNFWKPTGATTGSGNYHLFISDKGNVSVGTPNSKGYKFAVKGNMVAEEVVVKLHADWPDFVFTKNYGLMKLKDVEAFIKEHSHLPNVPSAKEVEKGGIKVGEMNRILLQKVEELTLYVIELEKQIEAVKNK